MSTSSPTTERAQEAASTAADEGRHVAEVAKEEAQSVASEAAAQARNLAGETVTQVTDQLVEQSSTQRDKLVGTLQSFSQDLDQMVAGNAQSGLAADLVREVADRARSFGSAIDGREPQELLNDVRTFARRRPGTFLLGALAAGVIAGRLARGAKQGSSASGSTTTGSAPTASGQTSPVAPAAPSTTPPPAPPSDLMGARHGQPTIEMPSGSAESSGLGSDAAGYGQRGASEGRPL